ncbi:uncharacterized protein pdgfbb [Gambusia affinis]|uniref:uncharacterized protein pdgfbb n=1 Tax=Gambusia affinis TaxID=33528 RepID=UPI001CDCFF62|nr:uncharacterized protein pdgfbb [Gambusia affinis]
MSSWVQLLLLAWMAACARFGVAEEDALPAALVELVRNSPINSIEDLQLLLLTDSVDEEEANAAANGGHRLPRSLDAQPAQQAQCKVRTEVVEVTRAMLDRSNANFLLWPPCVEVQRCSGCCNTKSLQCVPVVTHTRYLQVMKIEYINKRPTYAKAVVSVVDHVECRCQPAPRPAVLKKKSSHRLHSHLHRNQTLGPERQVKVHAKDELHQLDELKPNQRAHLEHLLGQHWDLRGDTFPRPGDGYSLAGEDVSRSEETVLFPPHWDHNFTRLLGTEEQIETQENVGMKNDEVFKDNARPPAGNVDVEAKTKLGEDGFNSTEGNPKVGHKHTQPHSPLGSDDKSKPFKSHTAGLSKGVAENSRAMLNPSEETIERARSRVRPTKEPNPEPREAAGRRENETPDVERMSQIAEERLEAERKELLLLHKRLDEEKELLRQQKMKQEEEESPKEKETDSQHLQHRKHHHLHTTTPKPETTTSTTTTQKALAPTGPRLPVRPNPQRRRMKKNRRRISKAAMRAMLM